MSKKYSRKNSNRPPRRDAASGPGGKDRFRTSVVGSFDSYLVSVDQVLSLDSRLFDAAFFTAELVASQLRGALLDSPGDHSRVRQVVGRASVVGEVLPGVSENMPGMVSTDVVSVVIREGSQRIMVSRLPVKAPQLIADLFAAVAPSGCFEGLSFAEAFSDSRVLARCPRPFRYVPGVLS